MANASLLRRLETDQKAVVDRGDAVEELNRLTARIELLAYDTVLGV